MVVKSFKILQMKAVKGYRIAPPPKITATAKVAQGEVRGPNSLLDSKSCFPELVSLEIPGKVPETTAPDMSPS